MKVIFVVLSVFGYLFGFAVFEIIDGQNSTSPIENASSTDDITLVLGNINGNVSQLVDIVKVEVATKLLLPTLEVLLIDINKALNTVEDLTPGKTEIVIILLHRVLVLLKKIVEVLTTANLTNSQREAVEKIYNSTNESITEAINYLQEVQNAKRHHIVYKKFHHAARNHHQN
ncbi:uncharacterized protein [Onthophagus taurus]|uniref:uncharacterized protein isoform X2 n=1 Tax=Onthophagus taurus TaxID=166361 RepID=UPI000C20C41D|nr:uncharacterized protein LOC111424635 [Onthophagus taurus]